MDRLTAAELNNYLFARAVVGRHLCVPLVHRAGKTGG
jgi:hypothetical protein